MFEMQAQNATEMQKAIEMQAQQATRFGSQTLPSNFFFSDIQGSSLVSCPFFYTSTPL